MNLHCIVISEGSQMQKAPHCLSVLTWHSGKGKTQGTDGRSWQELEIGGTDSKGTWGILSELELFLVLDCGCDYVPVYVHHNSQNSVLIR